MSHFPALQSTTDPNPTVKTQWTPLHSALQYAPLTPVQVEPARQVKLQLDVPPSHASNVQVLPCGHEQTVPSQGSGAHRIKPMARTAQGRTRCMDGDENITGNTPDRRFEGASELRWSGLSGYPRQS